MTTTQKDKAPEPSWLLHCTLSHTLVFGFHAMDFWFLTALFRIIACPISHSPLSEGTQTGYHMYKSKLGRFRYTKHDPAPGSPTSRVTSQNFNTV